MKLRKRPQRAAAIAAAASLLLQPATHLVAATASQTPAPARTAATPASSAAAAPAGGREARHRGGRPDRRRLAAHLQPAQPGQHPGVSAADLELGQAGPHRRLQRGVLPRQGGRQARARHDQDRSEHQGVPDRAPGQLPADEDRRSHLQHPGERAGARDRRDDRPGDTAGRSDDCARSCPGESGQEHDRARRTSRASRRILRPSSSARPRR